MTTATSSNPVMEIGVNWDIFEKSEQEVLKKGIMTGQYEHLAAMINELSPEKVVEIAKIQSRLRPKSFIIESDAQKEAEVWMSTHLNELTPEKEKEFQEKIDAERAEKLKQLGADVTEVKIVNTSDSRNVVVEVANNLDKITGLTDEEKALFISAGIDTADKYMNLSKTRKKEILLNSKTA